MTIAEHKSEFGGLKILDWSPGDTVRDLATTAYRISIEYDSEATWVERFEQFLGSPMAGFAGGIIAGPWHRETDDSAEEVVRALIAAADRLPNLTAIFVGDITFEENEISWIQQTDLGPLLTAYPQLRHFGSRGGDKLAYSGLAHASLRSLIVESGGLPREVVQQILAAELPALEHLELWLGDDAYGGDTKMSDLAPLFSGSRFPQLRTLGLRDSELADEIAAAIASSPLLDRLEVLDLSLGTLGDKGAEALLASAAARKLKKLDLHRHYITTATMRRFENFGPQVDLSEQTEEEVDRDGEPWRFVAVAE